MEALSGVKTEVEDPLLAFIQQQQPREAFTRFQRQAIDELGAPVWAEVMSVRFSAMKAEKRSPVRCSFSLSL